MANNNFKFINQIKDDDDLQKWEFLMGENFPPNHFYLNDSYLEMIL